MRLLITGASGFLGRAVVDAALRAGYSPIAMVRPTADVSGYGWPDEVEVVRGDLRQAGDWVEAVKHIDAIAHVAAATSGQLPEQLAGTVSTTENLLGALDLTRLQRFVLISSFSVYDYAGPAWRGKLTEDTPLETKLSERDAYTIAKLAQERLVTDTLAASECSLVVVRPGVIFGPGREWDFGRALKAGPFDLIFSPFARFRVTYVDNCADAIVAAVSESVPSGTVVNIVDDELPSHGKFHCLCRKAGGQAGVPLYVPWLAVAAIGLGVKGFNKLAFGGRAKLPEILAWRRQRVRWRPMRYVNRRAHLVLNWEPRIGLEEAVRRTIAGAAKVA